MMSPVLTVGNVVAADKVMVKCVPASFQAAPPRAPAPSNQECVLFKARTVLTLAALIVALLVTSLNTNTMVSPASLPLAEPVP